MKKILIITSIFLLHACKHPLAIEGEGDIVERLAGERGCTLEEFREEAPRCTDNEVVSEEYIVSYQPVPRDGWEFAAWENLNCDKASEGNNCDYNVSASLATLWEERFPGFVTPASVAVFRPEASRLNAFYEENIAGPIIETHCLDCHTATGSASQTRLVFEAGPSERQDIENITALGRFLDTVSEGRAYMLDTVSNPAAHGGVSTIAAGSEEYTELRSFLRMLEAEDLYEDGKDGVFTKNFAMVRNWAGRQTLNFSYYGTGSGETVTVQIKNNRAQDPGKEAWVLTWSEEFNEPAGTQPNPDIWMPEIGDGTANGIPGWGNSERQTYTGEPENAAMDGDGNLVITVKEADGSLSCYYGTCEYTSARLITNNKEEFGYGRIEARVKVPAGVGLWPAFWTLGTNIGSVGWPRTGEIDIMEFVGKEPNEIFGTIHGPGYSAGQSFGGEYLFDEPVYNDYHTFAVEWEPNLITWYVDDIEYHTATPELVPGDWVFEDPQFLILNMAIGGTFGGQIDPNIQLPASMLVDYVRVYSAPDTAELYETTFVDNVRGWREVEVSLGNLKRSRKGLQPEGAPNDGYSWFEVWGYNFVLPRGGSVLLNEAEPRF